MPVELHQIRDLLLPGFLEIQQTYTADQWGELFVNIPSLPQSRVIPTLSVKQAIIGAAAAAVIRNPVLTRRFWRMES